VCERIPSLILPVMQLSSKASSRAVGKPPGPPRSTEPKDPSHMPSGSRWACVDLHRTEGSVAHAVGQPLGMRRSHRTIRRSAASEPSGSTPGPPRSKPSAEASRKPSGSRRASVEPSAEATHASCRASRRARDERATEYAIEAIPASCRAAAGQAL